ncbi:MAG: hypothetical protein A2359_04890 [Candidatus Moranbacteria bacterium RIFOXYB1_FULL_43_19]|nr:MAG: hypothetical protein A2359_04890 [Candidatus Moranbacteria bacterium RIFOXYB1_FULL_43_19]OGI28350.1 MAG: hypothetical protein A2184_04220 [Candidatus Moranbacteria bacterium RIFOXYA1_FULL_44_7]OGI33589.1 MAG: hypothetical protein A2420_00520 [Candidatus Moranbacteria bacterium RIFOXYC1_FULL_44_13]OGI37133.1 MAG: hypothetical protein A2612_00050 [Candidatus Moranbacteria bacterium RIFOXYD1_FULL_44_12]
MLYEPPKTKKYILIGATAVVLAVLVIIAAPLLFKNKTTQTPTANLPLTAEQKKMQKEQDKLIEMAKKEKDSLPSQEYLKKESDRLIEEAKTSGAGKSQEEIAKDQEAMINAAKK